LNKNDGRLSKDQDEAQAEGMARFVTTLREATEGKASGGDIKLERYMYVWWAEHELSASLCLKRREIPLKEKQSSAC
jgi:hypothetical protein